HRRNIEMGFLDRLKDKVLRNEGEKVTEKYEDGMKKTRTSFSEKINALVARYRKVDEDFFEELEEVLITADVGVMTVMDLIDELKAEVKRQNIKDTNGVKEVISEKLIDIYYGEDDHEISTLNMQQGSLTVLLVVGVNGVGKTTTIGKLANQFKQEGKHVVLAA